MSQIDILYEDITANSPMKVWCGSCAAAVFVPCFLTGFLGMRVQRWKPAPPQHCWLAQRALASLPSSKGGALIV